MELKCSKCGNIWDYKGKSAFHATCPWCKRKNKIFIKENLKYETVLKCTRCDREFYRKRKSQTYCSALCNRRDASTKGGQALQKKYDMGDKNNPNWKGGISKDNYHYKKLQTYRYPERVKCRQAVIDAKRKGTIKVPSKCSAWGKDAKVHAHHEDYSKPLDIIWLCRSCHRKLHHNQH